MRALICLSQRSIPDTLERCKSIFDNAPVGFGGHSMIGITSCLYRWTLVLAFAVLNLFSYVIYMLALLAWSSMHLRQPDLMNFNTRILVFSWYSILFLSMTSSWIFFLETDTIENLFLLVLIFYSLSYCFVLQLSFGFWGQLFCYKVLSF